MRLFHLAVCLSAFLSVHGVLSVSPPFLFDQDYFSTFISVLLYVSVRRVCLLLFLFVCFCFCLSVFVSVCLSVLRVLLASPLVSFLLCSSVFPPFSCHRHHPHRARGPFLKNYSKTTKNVNFFK